MHIDMRIQTLDPSLGARLRFQLAHRFLCGLFRLGAHLDAGGGLVVLKESFESADAPAHLLHASCIVPFGHPAAEEFVRACGLPSVYCGGSGGDLTLSSAQEQTVLTLQRQLRRLDGTEVAAGDFVTALPEQLSPCEQLCCAAVLLMLGEKLPEG